MLNARFQFLLRFLLSVLVLAVLLASRRLPAAEDHAGHHHAEAVQFDLKSRRDGRWSDPATWQPQRVPRQGERVLIQRGTTVEYDAESDEVLRLVQVVGTLRFARDRNTTLNVAVLKVQSSDECSESGFACDFEGVNALGEPKEPQQGLRPTLEVGTPDNPIPRPFTARIRLHFQEGMDPNDAPALVCCSARMELHGSPLSHSWMKLGANVESGDSAVELAEPVTGWQPGDEVIVTGSEHSYAKGSFREDPDAAGTEQRRIKRIDGATLYLDRPLKHAHFGSGDFRSEVANLSRNVVIESADPDGIRGHTLYHAFSEGGISYARFAHLGKEGVLGRYAIHFHLVGDTMRGSQVLGAAIVDSHNRWVTVHGTEYLVIRDCVGYQSVGHGFFLEDGTEVFNLLDRNLGVQAYFGKRLPKQVMPFDPNDGAAFWWANGRNTVVRNVACENDRYGYRYDSQKRSNFDSELRVRMPDGSYPVVDIRTLSISRFSDNESHTEGLYSMAFAGTDGVGPDTQHPHRLRNLRAWQTHYALRAQLPTMQIEQVRIDHAAYGIYRPWFENHVYRDLHISHTGAEPFNRGLDDRSLQHGKITVDGLTFGDMGNGGQMPLIQISANNPTGEAESHFRNVSVRDRKRDDRWPVFNLGGGPRLTPSTPKGVPVYLHDHYGSGRHARIVSARAKDLLADGRDYQKQPPLTGDESLVAEVGGVEWPELLPVADDLPPVTVITQVLHESNGWLVRGISHDDGTIREVLVNGQSADLQETTEGVVDWQIQFTGPLDEIEAKATDEAGNIELTPHLVRP